MPRERLHKILAASGFGSRRSCEEIILDDRVTINGETVSVIPAFADGETDRIRVDGKLVKYRPELRVYIMLNKPKGVVTTASDPQNRMTVMKLVDIPGVRLFSVGRLDKETQGLLLLTNDGEMTKTLTHPRYEVEKVYLAHVAGEVDGTVGKRLRDGVYLSEGRAKAKGVKIVKKGRQMSVLEITLTEGKNRQVRRMLAKISLPVKKLTRIKFGPLLLRGVKPGKYRHLSKSEVRQLKMLVKSR